MIDHPIRALTVDYQVDVIRMGTLAYWPQIILRAIDARNSEESQVKVNTFAIKV